MIVHFLSLTYSASACFGRVSLVPFSYLFRDLVTKGAVLHCYVITIANRGEWL